MAKFIKLDLHETDVEVSFEVSKQYLKLWQESAESIDDTFLADVNKSFEQLVDSVYATLTHEQTKALFAEAMELHILSSTFNKGDTGYCYEVSARKHLSMCMMFSLSDSFEEVTD